MNDFIFISPHRCGSRWLYNILCELYDKQTTNEGETSYLNIEKSPTIVNLNNAIPKLHTNSHKDLFELLLHIYNIPDIKIVGIFRNPRDRAVSYAMHYRARGSQYKQGQAETDLDAIKYTIESDKVFLAEQTATEALMIPGYSTRCYDNNNTIPYIWTTYNWMTTNALDELKQLTKFIGTEFGEEYLLSVIGDHDFRTVTERYRGQEQRKNLWKRKGITSDYKNWFDDEMLELTKESTYKYWSIVLEEEFKGYTCH